MTIPIHPIETEETAPPQLTGMAMVYLPVLWMMGWIIRLATRQYDGAENRPLSFERDYTPPLITQNRHRRRALASCMRRAHRFYRKWGKPVDPWHFMPRAHAATPYITAMPKHWSVGRFMENYARDSGLGRARVFGLSKAHKITCADRSDLSQASGLLMTGLTARMDGSSLSFAAPADPAPP